MLFFLSKGYRVIAHDRRGHGRSSQPSTGHEMDTYVADVNVLTDHLDLQGAVHIGHSTGGGEVARYVAQAKPGRVSKAVLVSAVPPVMVKKDSNPEGTPIESSTDSVPRSPPIGPSSSSMSRPALSTASTGPGPRCPRDSSTGGGGRA